jgi:hypothetical protein
MSDSNKDALRAEITELLRKADYEGIIELSKKKSSVIRHLLALTYDKSDVLTWKAIEAIGKVTASIPPEKARNIIQRVLWMMREESGGNAWSGAEVLGEIIRNNPEQFKDIVPVVVSFHEEDIFRAGVLRAMARIGQTRADLIKPFTDLLLSYADYHEPSVRGYALLALSSLKMKNHLPVFERKSEDNACFKLYDGNVLVETPVKSIALKALTELKAGTYNP